MNKQANENEPVDESARDENSTPLYKPAEAFAKTHQVESGIIALLDVLAGSGKVNARWLAIARTHFEEGFMAMRRSIMDKRDNKTTGL